MRSVSINTNTTQKTQQVGAATGAKKAHEENQPLRVRELKDSAKKEKKKHKILRIKRQPMSHKQQRQFAKQLNSYQLKAMKDWYGFASTLQEEHLNEAQKFILQSALETPHLYPDFLRAKIRDVLSEIADVNDLSPPEMDSETLQDLVAYEHYLEGLLSLLVLCRKFDEKQRKLKDEQDDDSSEGKEKEKQDSPDDEEADKSEDVESNGQ